MALKYASSKYLDYSGALQVIGDIPLDIRNVVSVESDLITASTWYKNGSDSTTSIAYTGMLVSVAETGDVYICTNASAPTSLASWKKLASASDLSGLSGVFTFKGLATDISPDSKSIIIMTVPTSYTFIDILYDYAGEPFYKWQTPDKSNLNLPKILYTDENGDYYSLIADSQSDIQYVILANKIFYAGEDTVYTNKDGYLNEGEEITVLTFETLDGEYIYFYKSGSSEEYAGELINRFVSFPPNDTGELVDLGVGNTDILTFTAYKFEFDEILNAPDANTHLPYELLDNGDFLVITASSDNSGHVYQIGENEYASNGQIWVKLGSPVEDWIII